MLSDGVVQMVVQDFEFGTGYGDTSQMLDGLEDDFTEEGDGYEWDGCLVVLTWHRQTKSVTVSDMFCEFPDETVPWNVFREKVLYSKHLKRAKREKRKLGVM